MNIGVKICLLLLIGGLCLYAGYQYVLYGNIGLRAMHHILVALFCYYLPTVIFSRGDYRMVSYMVSLMLGFVMLMLMHILINPVVGFSDRTGWLEVLLYDSTAFMLIGFLGAMFNAKYVK